MHADPKDEFSDDGPYQPPPLPETPIVTEPDGGVQSTSSPLSPTSPPDKPDPAATPRAPKIFSQRTANAAPMNSVLAALKAEEASPIERVRLFVMRGNVADDYYIDRARPRRFRMLVNPRQGGPELIIVDNMQWVRTSRTGSWTKTPARKTPGSLPSMADLFRNGLSQAVEKAEPAGSRSVEGTIVWTNGVPCEGKLLLRIDAAGRPSLLRFEGLCGDQPLRFREAFSYTGPVTIVPPE